MNRMSVAALVPLAFLAACETEPVPTRAYSVAPSRQAPAALVSAPQELRESPDWVMIDTVRIEDSVRFDEADPGTHEQALADYFRREIRDQVLATQHFRVFGDFGDKSPHLAKYVVRGTLRRLDIGTDSADDGAPRPGADTTAQRGAPLRPLTCELRMELVATDKVDPRVGMPGETVAIGDAEVVFNVSPSLAPAPVGGAGAPGGLEPAANRPAWVYREQIPGSMLRAVRLALNDLLLNANDDVFVKEIRLAEEDRRAREERSRQSSVSAARPR